MPGTYITLDPPNNSGDDDDSLNLLRNWVPGFRSSRGFSCARADACVRLWCLGVCVRFHKNSTVSAYVFSVWLMTYPYSLFLLWTFVDLHYIFACPLSCSPSPPLTTPLTTPLLLPLVHLHPLPLILYLSIPFQISVHLHLHLHRS